MPGLTGQASGESKSGGSTTRFADNLGAMNVEVRTITADDWPLLREVSLRALADSPDAFRRTLAEVQASRITSGGSRPRGQHRSWWCWKTAAESRWVASSLPGQRRRLPLGHVDGARGTRPWVRRRAPHRSGELVPRPRSRRSLHVTKGGEAPPALQRPRLQVDRRVGAAPGRIGAASRGAAARGVTCVFEVRHYDEATLSMHTSRPDMAPSGSDLPTTWSVVPVKAASRVCWNLRDAACRSRRRRLVAQLSVLCSGHG